MCLTARLQAARLMLHAYEISFAHPGKGTELNFQAPYPLDFEQKLASLLKPTAGILSTGAEVFLANDNVVVHAHIQQAAGLNDCAGQA